MADYAFGSNPPYALRQLLCDDAFKLVSLDQVEGR
jgi:hypothetical protein